jgi:hypothetical protein
MAIIASEKEVLEANAAAVLLLLPLCLATNMKRVGRSLSRLF